MRRSQAFHETDCVAGSLTTSAASVKSVDPHTHICLLRAAHDVFEWPHKPSTYSAPAVGYGLTSLLEAGATLRCAHHAVAERRRAGARVLHSANLILQG